jgi:hypothetical protein
MYPLLIITNHCPGSKRRIPPLLYLWRTSTTGICGLLCLGFFSLAGAEPPTDAQLQAIWEKQAAAIRTADFLWTTRREIPRRRLSNAALENLAKIGALEPPAQPLAPLPADGVFATETIGRFLLAGERMRYEERGQTPSLHTDNRLGHVDEIQNYDGHLYKMLQTIKEGDKEQRQGTVGEKKNWLLVRRPPAVTILLWYMRPQVFLKNQIGQRSPQVVEKGFVTLSPPAETPSVQRVITLDSAKGYLPIHYQEKDTRTQQVLQEWHILSRQEAAAVWVPTAWTLTSYLEKGEVAVTTSQVTRCRLNADVAAQEFQLDFPAETSIVYLDSQGHPHQTPPPAPTGRWPWLVPMAVLLLLLLAGVGYWQKRRRRASSASADRHQGDGI